MKKYILPVVTLTILLLPGAVAHAANLPLLDPNFSIVPEACRADCPCGVGAALQFIQNIMNVLISFAVVVMSLIIAWAGFLFVMSAANPESRSKARGMLINAFIGLFIVLSAWLIVDFIMKRLYGDGSTAFGPWNKILVLDGSQCIDVNNNLGQIQGLPGVVGVAVNGVPGGTAGAGTGSPGISVGGGSCTPIPDSQLVAIDSAGHKLIPDYANKFKAMKAAAAKDGVTLNVSSAYRSPEDQLAAWNNNGCQLVNGRAVCRVRTAAIPCSLPGGTGSNHTRGTAVDITLNSGVYAWLRAHASSYGFYNSLSNDLPHWSDTGR